jgi:hypothetical protein
VLGLGGLHDRPGQRGGASDLAVLQPGLDASHPGTADPGRGLVAGQQDNRTLVGQLQDALQRRADFHQLSPEPVDLPRAVADHVRAPGGQGPQVDGNLTTGPQTPQVLAHAGLIGDDERVLRIGLALTPVGARGPVDGESGDVGHGLVVAEQKPDQQRGTTVVGVHRPQHVLVEGQHVTDQLQQGRFVVQDPAGQQPPAVRIDHHAVMVFLADVHTGPYLRHGHLRQLVVVHRSHRRPRRRCPTQRSNRDSQLAVESSWGSGRPSSLSHQAANTMQPYPEPLGSTDLTNDQFKPTSER